MDFEQLANEHKDAVYRQMVRVCGNREDAEDVLIEALLKAYHNLQQLRDSVAFRSWLAQIARRVCWQLKDRERLLPVMQLSVLEDEGKRLSLDEMPADAQATAKQMRSLVKEAVAALPDGYREVYEMRDIEDVPGESVAERLGISLAAMKSRLRRSRQFVREQLDAVVRKHVTS